MHTQPFYKTKLGKAYLGDAFHLIKTVPDESVNLIVTSPPFALRRKKEYGNVPASEYVDWFEQFTDDFGHGTASHSELGRNLTDRVAQLSCLIIIV